jgi:hypothetical protein
MELFKKIGFMDLASFTTNYLRSLIRATTTLTLKILRSIGSAMKVNLPLFRLFLKRFEGRKGRAVFDQWIAFRRKLPY